MAVTLVEPWSLDIVLHRKHHDLAVELHHVPVELYKEAGSVAPAHPRCAVIVYHHCRVDVVPPAARAVVGHRIHDQRLADRIGIRALRPVGDCDSHCLAVRVAALCRHIEIILSVRSFDGLRSPCLAYRPCEVGRFHDHSMIRPCLHVLGRIAEPFRDIEAVLAFVSRPVLEAFVMSAEHIKPSV